MDLATKGPSGVPCLVERKAAEVVTGGGEEPSISANSVHFWAEAAQVPLVLSTVFEDGLVAPTPPRCLPGLIDGLAEEIREDGEVFMARGQSHQGAPPISHGFVFCAAVPWSVVLLKVVGE